MTDGTSIPEGAVAAVLNVTVVDPATAGFLMAYPQGSVRPNSSNLNFTAGQTTTNRVIVPLSTTSTTPGQITLWSTAATDVVVDASGYFSAAGSSSVGTQFNAEATPVRICDTRAVTSFSPQNQCSNKPIASGGTDPLPLTIRGMAGIPANATAVVVNLTGVTPTQSTFLTVFPGGPAPNASDLNPAAGETRANLDVATINPTSGEISIFNQSGSINVVVDVLGWYS
jgi:hypothetical protein